MRVTLFILIAVFFAGKTNAQNVYKGEPLIFANQPNVAIAIGQEWYPGRWTISPKIAHDTLKVLIYGKTENVAFKTDRDSIRFTVETGQSKSFYIKMGDLSPSHTIITPKPFIWDVVHYSKDEPRKDLKIYYEDTKSPYFDTLRSKYPIDQVIKNDKTDKEKVLSILNWTHHQWKHDGGNAPKGNDAISILNEVKAGGRFPCFAYAIVLRDQLIAHGFKARVLYLKTKDASTRKGSPGHVVTEVFLKDLKKWAYVDGQFNVMPTLNGTPLNAVEFQNALSVNYDNVVLASRDNVSKRAYTEFVYDYLYYFDTSLDNRLIPPSKSFKLEGMSSLMLVPVGAPKLDKIDFWNSKVDYCIYSNSLNDFYAPPG